jgi:hypothetical protein
VTDSLIKGIAKKVDECMQPHLETIQHNKDALILQEIQNKKQNDQISSMFVTNTKD